MLYTKQLLILCLLASAALVPLGALSAADPGASSLSLGSALARALERSPELATYSWDIRAAEARIIQARLRPNPELSVQAENMTGSGDFANGDQAERTLQLSQLVELGGKLPARIGEAEAGRAVAEFDYQVKRVDVLRATTQAFVDVLVAQRAVQLAEDTAALADKVTPLTQRRVEVGKASAVEVTRSNIAVASAKIDLEQTRRTLATARGNLALQWGARRADFGSVTGDLDRVKALPSQATLAGRIMRNPQLVRWTAERERREAAVTLAQAQARPDMTVFGGPRVFGKADDIAPVVGVSIPLPFSNRNQGAIAEAQANVSKTEEERRAVEARAFASLNQAFQTLARAANEVEILRRDVLPGAREAEELITAGYEAGRFTQLEILDARRTLIGAQNQNLRALADYHKALAEIEALTAEPVDLSSYKSVQKSNGMKPPKESRKRSLFRF